MTRFERTALATLLLLVLGATVLTVTAAPAPPGQFPQAVSTSASGVVRIDPWTCFTPPQLGMQPAPGPVAPAAQALAGAKPCPIRIEIAHEVPGDVIVCRSTEAGQTCKTVEQLFGQ